MLTKALTDGIPERSLPSSSLDASAHSSLPQMFDNLGRNRLLRSLLVTIKHAGVLGVVILQLKENIEWSIKNGIQYGPFVGDRGNDLISLTLSSTLPNKERTDLLEWSDSIMTVLNLLYYLMVRDKDNITQIYDVKPQLRKSFLEPLQKGLDLSRGHYQLKLTELKDPIVKKKKQMEFSVSSIGGVPL